MAKSRLDKLIVDRGLVPSRREAYAAIVAGDVAVDGQVIRKVDARVDTDAGITVRVPAERYVSRGGLKLEGALDHFGIDVARLVALDAGSATGGFTDCLLRRGARKVIAVDVGYGQLAWKLRQDPRVELHERINLRYLRPEDIGGPADIATLDLSFISLTKVIDAVLGCLKPDGRILALVKPQFEAGRELVGKKGVVRDPAVHRQVLLDLARFFAGRGLSVMGLTWSPLLGPAGNIEFWVYLAEGKPGGLGGEKLAVAVDQVAAAAHAELLGQENS